MNQNNFLIFLNNEGFLLNFPLNISINKNDYKNNIISLSNYYKYFLNNSKNSFILSKNIFNSFVNKDNNKIVKILKKLLTIYSRKIKIKKFLYFQKYLMKSIENKEVQQTFNFNIKKENIYDKLYKDSLNKNIKLEYLKQKYMDEEEKYTFSPKINTNYNLTNRNHYYKLNQKYNEKKCFNNSFLFKYFNNYDLQNRRNKSQPKPNIKINKSFSKKKILDDNLINEYNQKFTYLMNKKLLLKKTKSLLNINKSKQNILNMTDFKINDKYSNFENLNTIESKFCKLSNNRSILNTNTHKNTQKIYTFQTGKNFNNYYNNEDNNNSNSYRSTNYKTPKYEVNKNISITNLNLKNNINNNNNDSFSRKSSTIETKINSSRVGNINYSNYNSINNSINNGYINLNGNKIFERNNNINNNNNYKEDSYHTSLQSISDSKCFDMANRYLTGDDSLEKFEFLYKDQINRKKMLLMNKNLYEDNKK